LARAQALAGQYGAEPLSDWKQVVACNDVDTVIVAVPNFLIAPIVLAALRHGKDVLSEKPFGTNSKESLAMLKAAKRTRRLLKVGFNHRFYPAILRAHEIFHKGGIGQPLFIRARYGHGGRKGMEKEWRLNPKISGGGELLDQGVHIIDLAQWFGGRFKVAYGLTETKFWKAKVDDNAFAILRNDTVTAEFHVSTTNWGNIFSFEVFGDRGFLRAEGKGGHYGEATLIYGVRAETVGLKSLRQFHFGKEDHSWELEWRNFAAAAAGKAKLLGDAEDGLRANRIVEAIYKASRTGKEVRLTLD
jgi:predicted dehydrogenase